jgi:ATP-dependent Lhr-like helicase
LRLIAAEPITSRGIAVASRLDNGSRRDAAIRARLKSSLSGRWSLAPQLLATQAPALEHEATAADRAREIANVLLARHGILAREMLALDQIDLSWSELAFALRRMEYAGVVRRGWFVRALSGEQYATPEALATLAIIRAGKGSQEFSVLSAVDPVNPFGALLPGCGIVREPNNLLVVKDGRVLLGLSGRNLMIPAELTPSDLRNALAALTRIRPKLVIETLNEAPALQTDHVDLFAAMRFHSDGRALVYDGLPGPAPARAAPTAAH